jgi:serine phosphatase RsbU (regulator of sigma subunit)
MTFQKIPVKMELSLLPTSNASKNKKAKKMKNKYFYHLILFMSSLFFLVSVSLLSKAYNAEKSLQDLIENESALKIDAFDLILQRCTGEICQNVSEIKGQSLSQTDEIKGLFKTHKPDRVELHFVNSFAVYQFLREHKSGNLIFPRFAHNRTDFFVNESLISTHIGMGNNVNIAMFAEDFTSHDRVRIIVDTQNLPFFGTTSLPAALVSNEYSSKFNEWTVAPLFGSYSNRQIEIGIPLIVAIFVFFLRKNRIFETLLLLCFARACYSFLSLMLDQRLLHETLFYSVLYDYKIISVVFGFFCSLRTYTSILFGLSLIGSELSSRHLKALFSLNSIAFVLLFVFREDSIIKGDVYSDTIASLFVVSSCFFRLFLQKEQKSTLKVKTNASIRKTYLENKYDLYFTCVALVAFTLLFLENLGILAKNAAVKDVLNWGSALFYPSIAFMAFIRHAASEGVWNILEKDIERHGQLESELSTAAAIMKTMQGSRKSSFEGLSWRAFQRQSVSIGGDFFDVRRLEFDNNESLIVGLVGDVTGHGIQAALVANAVATTWGAWCRDVVLERRNKGEKSKLKRPRPVERADREQLLSRIPKQIDSFLSAAKVPGTLTTLFVLYDPISMELTLCTCGHPSPFMFTEGAHKSIICPSNGNLGFGVPENEWKTLTITVKEGDRLYMFSDGLFSASYGVNLSSFRKRPRLKSGDKVTNSDPALMWRLFRDVRAHYVFNKPEDEDDITLVSLHFNQSQSSDLLPHLSTKEAS